MEIEEILLSQLIPADYNPRKISDEDFKKLDNSMENFGLVDPIIINLKKPSIINQLEYYIVIGGHQRLDVLLRKGVKKAHLLRLGDVGWVFTEKEIKLRDENTVKALNIALNKISGEWNESKLAALLSNLEVTGFDVELTGFDQEEILELQTELKSLEPIKEDEFDIEKSLEEIETPTTKPGDIYQLDQHKLMCGDSTKKEDVKKLMNGIKSDMVFTSPPYWVGKDYEYQENEKEINQFIEKIVKNLNNYTSKDKSRIIINTGTGNGRQFTGKVETYLLIDKWVNYLKQKGWLLRHLRFWIKSGGLPATISPNTDLIDQHSEFIATFYHPKGKHRGQNKLNEKWVQQGFIDDIKGNSNSEGHGATFPLEPPSRFIKLYSNKENLILEPFGGTGTTLIACEQLKRKCYTLEIEPKYCDVIIQRWEQFTGQKAEKINPKQEPQDPHKKNINRSKCLAIKSS